MKQGGLNWKKRKILDEINYINNLNGNINYRDNKINDLELLSVFPNEKKN